MRVISTKLSYGVGHRRVPSLKIFWKYIFRVFVVIWLILKNEIFLLYDFLSRVCQVAEGLKSCLKTDAKICLTCIRFCPTVVDFQCLQIFWQTKNTLSLNISNEEEIRALLDDIHYVTIDLHLTDRRRCRTRDQFTLPQILWHFCSKNVFHFYRLRNQTKFNVYHYGRYCGPSSIWCHYYAL